MAIVRTPAARAGALYFGLQGLAGVGWWIALAAWPATRPAFVAAAAPTATLFALAPADALFVGGSFAASVAIATRAKCAAALAWLTAGATGYATLYCVGLWLLAGASAIGTMMMLPAALASVLAALATHRGERP